MAPFWLLQTKTKKTKKFAGGAIFRLLKVSFKGAEKKAERLGINGP